MFPLHGRVFICIDREQQEISGRDTGDHVARKGFDFLKRFVVDAEGLPAFGIGNELQKFLIEGMDVHYTLGRYR